MEAYVKEQPDAFLREIADHFNCRPQSVWIALKKIGEKTTHYREQSLEKVRRFLTVLSAKTITEFWDTILKLIVYNISHLH